jgi:hypothetical protein
MASLLQRLSLATMPIMSIGPLFKLFEKDAAPGFYTLRSPVYGSSKRTVAQDRRAATKRRAKIRAKKHGQA